MKEIAGTTPASRRACPAARSELMPKGPRAMGKANPRSDRDKEPDPHRPVAAAAKERVSTPSYLGLEDLRQLIDIITGSIPTADPDIISGSIPHAYAQYKGAPGVVLAVIGAYGVERWLSELALHNLHHDLDQAGRRFRLRGSLDTYASSTADIETLGRREIHLGELVRDLNPTAGNKMSPLFRMLLLETQSPEDIALFHELAKRFHGAMNRYRCTHSPRLRTRRHARLPPPPLGSTRRYIAARYIGAGRWALLCAISSRRDLTHPASAYPGRPRRSPRGGQSVRHGATWPA
jgi:hypothetical protein